MQPIQSDALAEYLYRHFGFADMSEGWDGNAYAVLVGPNLQEGQAWFGPTPADAMEAITADVRAVGAGRAG